MTKVKKTMMAVVVVAMMMMMMTEMKQVLVMMVLLRRLTSSTKMLEHIAFGVPCKRLYICIFVGCDPFSIQLFCKS
jgi:hypothetical protein